MSEPLLPVPPPEPDSNWDPMPPRCPHCGSIIDDPDHDGKGWCPTHKLVAAVYGSQDD